MNEIFTEKVLYFRIITEMLSLTLVVLTSSALMRLKEAFKQKFKTFGKHTYFLSVSGHWV